MSSQKSWLTPFNICQPHPLRHLLSNPIPFKHPEKSSIFQGTRFIPFPLSRGRGIVYVREASPLFDFLYFSPFLKGGGWEKI